MALMLGQLYDALRAGNVPDDKARAAAEEVANYEGELSKLRLDMSVHGNGKDQSGGGRAAAPSLDDRLSASRSSSVCSRCNGRFC